MGFWKVFHENGQLEGRTNYKDGKLEGIHEGYYEEGGLMKTEIRLWTETYESEE